MAGLMFMLMKTRDDVHEDASVDDVIVEVVLRRWPFTEEYKFCIGKQQRSGMNALTWGCCYP
jgi:hypothetical protein